MKRSQRRLIWLMVGIPLLVVFSGLFYMLGMSLLEGKTRGFWDSVEWAAESLSTTGYGADAHWSHPLMVVYVILIQFIGVFLVFLIVPIYLVPFLEERFEERLKRRADPKLSDHVIVFHYGPSVESLLERLKEASISALVAERDEATARALVERQIPVVFIRAEDEALTACNLETARAVVANGRDEENGALILRARQLGFKGAMYALVEEPAHRRPMELAGATAAYTPRHILAAALAARASERITPPILGIEQVDGFELRQYRIRRDQAEALHSSQISEAGVRVAGVWHRGTLLTRNLENVPLERGAILLLLGSSDKLDAVEQKISAIRSLRRDGNFLIAGFGEVGAKVHELLTDVEEPLTAIDRREGARIDVVGNVLDPELLRRAGIESARAVILALDSDDATLFATVIARSIVPDTPIIARVNHARNIENIYSAGADFALSISDVSGQMLSYRLVGDRPLVGGGHLEVMRVSGERFVGKRRSEIADATSCNVIAIEHEGEVRATLDDTPIRATDVLFVCGTSDRLRALR